MSAVPAVPIRRDPALPTVGHTAGWQEDDAMAIVHTRARRTWPMRS